MRLLHAAFHSVRYNDALKGDRADFVKTYMSNIHGHFYLSNVTPCGRLCPVKQKDIHCDLEELIQRDLHFSELISTALSVMTEACHTTIHTTDLWELTCHLS